MGLTIIATRFGEEQDSLDIGYCGFDWLRRDLCSKVGYRYDDTDPLNPILHWTDESDKSELTRFFLHSDCDERVSKSDLKRLYQDFKDLKFDDINAQGRFDEFLPFLKSSVESESHWIFA